MYADKAPPLDGDYAAIGIVLEDLEIVDAICEAEQPTDGNGSVAVKSQTVITSVTDTSLLLAIAAKKRISCGFSADKCNRMCYNVTII